jgi:protein phosphatase 1L
MNSGACSVSALVSQGQLVVANAGDCKAVRCRAGKDERQRIEDLVSDIKSRKPILTSFYICSLSIPLSVFSFPVLFFFSNYWWIWKWQGGFVACVNGIWRLQGTLAVTRGFGDNNLKQWVSSRPDVTKLKLTPECEFLILASDGLWDKVINKAHPLTHRHMYSFLDVLSYLASTVMSCVTWYKIIKHTT